LKAFWLKYNFLDKTGQWLPVKQPQFCNRKLETLNWELSTGLPFVVPIRRLSKNALHFVDYKVI
jgi:hypothetical protein